VRRFASPGSIDGAEATLIVSLLGCANLRYAALTLNIAFTTARTHLAHIFQNTGHIASPNL
jgi:hypothetical protein